MNKSNQFFIVSFTFLNVSNLLILFTNDFYFWIGVVGFYLSTFMMIYSEKYRVLP